MAGLLTDRPPQTDGDCARWLTIHCGEPDVQRAAVGRSVVWMLSGREVRAHGGVGAVKSWSFASASGLTARELGAILWCAERFPEVKP
jgi:hypothetical protein